MGRFGAVFLCLLENQELTVPKEDAYDPSIHLSVGDIALDDPKCPSFVRVSIKQSKTDPFCQGVDVSVGRKGNDLCPVAAILDYLQSRGTTAGPLYIISDGRPLTRERFVTEMREMLKKAGIDQQSIAATALGSAPQQRWLKKG